MVIRYTASMGENRIGEDVNSLLITARRLYGEWRAVPEPRCIWLLSHLSTYNYNVSCTTACCTPFAKRVFHSVQFQQLQ